MAVIKFTNSKSSIKKILDYIAKPDKTEEKLISGKDCMYETALQEMLFVKNMFNKTKGRQYIHIVQSFDPNDELDYKKANEIGVKLSEYFDGFQAVIATHKDRNHIHNHILLNSVNFKTGLKFQQSKKDMEKIKQYSDKLCFENNLSVIEKPNINSDIKRNEYQVALKGESWKIDLILAIDEVLKISSSKKDFIKNMNSLGYEVNWTDKRKHITYTTPTGKKCRDNKLHDKKYLKQEMENEFRKIEKNTIGEEGDKPESIIGYLHSNRGITETDNQQSKPSGKTKKESILKRLEVEKVSIENRESEKRNKTINGTHNHYKYYHNSNIADDILD